MQFDEIYPNVIVYKDVYEDVELFYERLKFVYENTNGDFIFGQPIKWFIFGDYMMSKEPGLNLEPSSTCQEYEKYVFFEMCRVFDIVFEHYKSYTDFNLPKDYFIKNHTPSRYVPEENLEEPSNFGLRMAFHSDYKIQRHDMPLENLLISCNHYVNDDYDGGEIVFLLDEDIIPYKPVAGDVVVFPSGSPDYYNGTYPLPYFHAANTSSGGYKHFIRSAVAHVQEGSEYWNSEKSKFSTEEDWQQHVNELDSKDPVQSGVFFGSLNNTNNAPNFVLSQYNSGDPFFVRCTENYMEKYNLHRNKNYING